MLELVSTQVFGDIKAGFLFMPRIASVWLQLNRNGRDLVLGQMSSIASLNSIGASAGAATTAIATPTSVC